MNSTDFWPQQRVLVTGGDGFLEELFGFEATTDFRAGLERTIAWYRAQVARTDV